MRVIHILKDGSRVNDITGRIVKMSDAQTLYNLLDRKVKKVNKNVRNRNRNRIHNGYSGRSCG